MPRDIERLQRALREVQSGLARNENTESIHETVEEALASGEADAMRKALSHFDMLETQIIEINRKAPDSISEEDEEENE